MRLNKVTNTYHLYVQFVTYSQNYTRRVQHPNGNGKLAQQDTTLTKLITLLPQDHQQAVKLQLFIRTGGSQAYLGLVSS